jgi:ParB-like chromosome segregation protein Spo0J
MSAPLKIKTAKVADLTPDPHNARRHSERNLQQITDSLREFGQRRPIVITGDKTVIAGNGTLEAAKRLGWETIAVVQVPITWTFDEARAYALADNRTAELARWNTPILADQLEALGEHGWTPAGLGFEFADSPEPRQDGTREVDLDSFQMQHSCPSCGFDFDA